MYDACVWHPALALQSSVWQRLLFSLAPLTLRAQDTTKPSIENFTFGNQTTTKTTQFHNGITPFQLAVTFSEPVFALDGGALGKRVPAQGDVYYETCGTALGVCRRWHKTDDNKFCAGPYKFEALYIRCNT